MEENIRNRGEIRLKDCSMTATFGVYGEIGLLLSQGLDAGSAIQENWRKLLGK